MASLARWASVIFVDSRGRGRSLDSVPLIEHLLGFGSGRQPPGEQAPEGVEEDLSLIGVERPPDRLARKWVGWGHTARGGTDPSSWRSIAFLLGLIAFV